MPFHTYWSQAACHSTRSQDWNSSFSCCQPTEMGTNSLSYHIKNLVQTNTRPCQHWWTIVTYFEESNLQPRMHFHYWPNISSANNSQPHHKSDSAWPYSQPSLHIHHDYLLSRKYLLCSKKIHGWPEEIPEKLKPFKKQMNYHLRIVVLCGEAKWLCQTSCENQYWRSCTEDIPESPGWKQLHVATCGAQEWTKHWRIRFKIACHVSQIDTI